MKEITNLMLNVYKLEEIDFMGYEFNKSNASFHHLLVPRRRGGEESIENGAILNRKTSHPYLHIVEGRDYEKFLEITSEMLDENIKGRLDIENIKRIDEILDAFEREHSGDTTAKGRSLIKEEYVEGRKKLLKL